jgi:hypothetical protein
MYLDLRYFGNYAKKTIRDGCLFAYKGVNRAMSQNWNYEI